MANRVVSAERGPEDLVAADRALRPRSLSSFVGQSQIRRNLGVFIDAARGRSESLDHVLLSGPPGLGKTTMAQIISLEMGSRLKVTSGPAITKQGDLAALLTNLAPNDILFIDEVHRMSVSVEEILYPAMEDFKIDIFIGEGQTARAIRLNLPQFTLVAATTRLGLLSQPLRERFGIPLKFDFYTTEELSVIIKQNASILHCEIDQEAVTEIALRARGTPRIASRLLRRVRDFATFANTKISEQVAIKALNQLEVDRLGLDSEDKKYLRLLSETFSGGPVGLETISAALFENTNTIEEVIEPYLLKCGLIQKTTRGRIITQKGKLTTELYSA